MSGQLLEVSSFISPPFLGALDPMGNAVVDLPLGPAAAYYNLFVQPLIFGTPVLLGNTVNIWSSTP